MNLARLQLQVLMGMDTEVEIAADGNLKDYEMVMFRRQMESNQLNLNNNSDLKQLDLNADLLKKTLAVQRTNFMPTLAASFNYSYTSLNNDFKMSHYKWFPYSTVGLSLSIPLFKASNFTKVKSKLRSRCSNWPRTAPTYIANSPCKPPVIWIIWLQVPSR